MASVDLDIETQSVDSDIEQSQESDNQDSKSAKGIQVDDDEIEFSAVNITLPEELKRAAAEIEQSEDNDDNNVIPITNSMPAGASEREVSALINAAVAQANSEFIAEHAGNAKVLEHQVNSWVNSMYKKNPGLKNELLQLKKLVVDYAKPTNFALNPKKKKAA